VIKGFGILRKTGAAIARTWMEKFWAGGADYYFIGMGKVIDC